VNPQPGRFVEKSCENLLLFPSQNENLQGKGLLAAAVLIFTTAPLHQFFRVFQLTYNTFWAKAVLFQAGVE